MDEQHVRIIKRDRYRDGVLVCSDEDSVTVRFPSGGEVLVDADAEIPQTLTFPRVDVSVVEIPQGS